MFRILRIFVLLIFLFALIGVFVFTKCQFDICLEAQIRVEDLWVEMDVPGLIKRIKKKLNPKAYFQAKDTIVFKDGSMIQGIIEDENGRRGEVFIKIDGGVVSFTKDEIADIRHGETLVTHESGVQTAELPDEEMPYPRVYLKNGNIVYGSGISKEEDESFYVKQDIEGGGTVSYGFKVEEIEKIRLWPMPPEKELPAYFRKMRRQNFKYSEVHDPFYIISSVESSDSVVYFRALQRVYEDALMTFFDFIDLNNPHEAFPVILFGDYNNFLQYAGIPAGTNIQGFYVPSNKTLHLYNVKEIDIVDFQLRQASAAKGALGQAMTHIENTDYGANSGKWAAYDRIEKANAEVEKYEQKLQYIARLKTIQTVRHEAMHQFLHYLGLGGGKGYFGAWFTEGLASYFEPEYMDQMNVDRLMYLRYEKDEGYGFMPLQHLMSFEGGADIHKVAANYTLSAYAQSWAFVYYLMSKYPAQFFDYMKALRDQPKGFDSEKDIKLLEEKVGKTLPEMEKEFEPYIQGLMETDVDEEEYFNFKFFQMQAAG